MADDLATSPVFSRTHAWSKPPTVHICEGAPVTYEQVRRVVLWYRQKCVPVRRRIVHDKCEWNQDPPVQTDPFEKIYIVEAVLDPSTLGETYVIAPGGYTVSAMIGLSPLTSEQQMSLVLAHELGHALGWMIHYPDTGHVMSESFDTAGWSSVDMIECKRGI